MTEKEIKAVKILIRALEWYANKKNWRTDEWEVLSIVESPEYGNPGAIARGAILSFEKELKNNG